MSTRYSLPVSSAINACMHDIQRNNQNIRLSNKQKRKIKNENHTVRRRDEVLYRRQLFVPFGFHPSAVSVIVRTEEMHLLTLKYDKKEK